MTTDPTTTTEAIAAAIEAISAAVDAAYAAYADALYAVAEAYVAYTRCNTTGDPMTRLQTDVDGPEGLSEADLATIAARADAATPGPWWAWDRGVGWHIVTEDPATADVPALLPEGIRTDLGRREDAEFIAHAREDVPRLAAEVRRLRAHHEHCAWGACGSCEDVALERDAAQADLELLRARVAELEQALARAEAAEQERDDPRKDAYRAHPGVGDVDDTPLLHCARWESILADIQAAADALLMAAITLRDLYGAMPPRLRATCPPDLANRIESTRYQDAFDALPAGIRAAAEAAMRADPDIVAARRIHASGGSHADI